eukprot:scaffold461770_cov13-Prasinocladus_malaysianus.AAC.1
MKPGEMEQRSMGIDEPCLIEEQKRKYFEHLQPRVYTGLHPPLRASEARLANHGSQFYTSSDYMYPSCDLFHLTSGWRMTDWQTCEAPD